MTYRDNNKIEQTRFNFLVLLSFIGLPFCIYSKNWRRRLCGRRRASLPCILSVQPMSRQQLQASFYPLSRPSLSLQVEYYSHLLSYHLPLPSSSCLRASPQVHSVSFLQHCVLSLSCCWDNTQMRNSVDSPFLSY